MIGTGRAAFLSITAALCAALVVPRVNAVSSVAVPADDKTIIHVLNRIGFGPGPGDVEEVRQIGLERFIERQLHPERLADTALDARLARLTTIGMSSQEIAQQYERPLLDARRDRRQQANADAQPGAAGPPQGEKNAVQQAANTVFLEMSEQKLLRAIYSERQLQEVLADFWFNHFNVDARKGRVRFLLTEYEREAIRPHVLGNFRDLLEATAKSPAMLFYLDNWMSADPDAATMGMSRGRAGRGRLAARPQPRNAPRGLNENYGRELLELHTLGVDGGYTQKDVTEVARSFTGWTIENPRQGGSGFRFEPRLHDGDEKVVLGHRIKTGGGMSDGEQVLDILAGHPSTARFIATKLARRFISDTPPPAVIDRAAARFSETDGDLREVVRAILTSPEFLTSDAYGAKVKSPFEFVVSAVRATGVEVTDARQLVRTLQAHGMPLYQCQPPTGYKDSADAWVTAGALMNRMNFALALGQRPQVAGRQPVLDDLLAHDVSAATRATIAKASTTAQAVALAIGSPEFQRR